MCEMNEQELAAVRKVEDLLRETVTEIEDLRHETALAALAAAVQATALRTIYAALGLGSNPPIGEVIARIQDLRRRAGEVN